MNDTTTVFQDEIPNFNSYGTSISTLAPPESNVRVPENNSDWIISLQDRFDKLTSLPLGWDGYEGRPVSFTTAQFAANLIERLFTRNLRPPQLVPGSDGTLQIEWHQNQLDIEIDILKPYSVIATYYNHVTDNTEEIELQSDFNRLYEWIVELEQNQNHDPEREVI